jgi:hypothetical protein
MYEKKIMQNIFFLRNKGLYAGVEPNNEAQD